MPYAGDQWYLHRQQDANGRFFWKVAQQGHMKDQPLDNTRQGIYVATPDGQLLGSINSWSPERTLAVFQKALERWQQRPHADTVVPASLSPDADYERKPPKGGLILNIYSRIPLPPPPGEAGVLNSATGRDHLWLTAAEWRSLLPSDWRNGARYPVPQAVVERLLRFHLVDNVRGEPPMWTRADLQQADLTLVVENAAKARLRLEGKALMQHGAERGYETRIQGVLVYDRQHERFSRFDLVSWGEAWGHGPYTGGEPKGRFPLVIAASIAGRAPADLVPPQALRNRQEYFGR